MKTEVKETWYHLQRTFPLSKNRQLHCLETSGTKRPVTQRHIPEVRVSHPYGYENLKIGIGCIYVIPDKIQWPAVVKVVTSLIIA
jgi:hypothetical protein